MIVRSASLALMALALTLGGANAFVSPSAQVGAAAKSATSVNSAPPTSTGWDSFERMNTLVNVPSGEEQRKFRRTVYSHDDWKRHRNQNRFLVYLAAIFKSGVYKNLAGEVILTTAVATFVVFYNALVGEYQDFSGAVHQGLIHSPLFPKLGLPMSAFTLTSPSLGLLLGAYILLS